MHKKQILLAIILFISLIIITLSIILSITYKNKNENQPDIADAPVMAPDNVYVDPNDTRVYVAPMVPDPEIHVSRMVPVPDRGIESLKSVSGWKLNKNMEMVGGVRDASNMYATLEEAMRDCGNDFECSSINVKNVDNSPNQYNKIYITKQKDIELKYSPTYSVYTKHEYVSVAEANSLNSSAATAAAVAAAVAKELLL